MLGQVPLCESWRREASGLGHGWSIYDAGGLRHGSQFLRAFSRQWSIAVAASWNIVSSWRNRSVARSSDMRLFITSTASEATTGLRTCNSTSGHHRNRKAFAAATAARGSVKLREFLAGVCHWRSQSRSGSSTTTSVTIPTHAVGDMIVIMADQTVAPTAPAAGGTVPTWTTPTDKPALTTQWLAAGYAIADRDRPHVGHLDVGGADPRADPAPDIGQHARDRQQPGAGRGEQHADDDLPGVHADRREGFESRHPLRGERCGGHRGPYRRRICREQRMGTEQRATAPTSAVFTKVVTASEGTFTATPAGSNAAYRCGTLNGRTRRRTTGPPGTRRQPSPMLRPRASRAG